jgi:hypothetical protein
MSARAPVRLSSARRSAPRIDKKFVHLLDIPAMVYGCRRRHTSHQRSVVLRQTRPAGGGEHGPGDAEAELKLRTAVSLLA